MVLLEYGINFYNPKGEVITLCVPWMMTLSNFNNNKSMLIVLGDHPEGNEFCAIYMKSCRICHENIPRTKENAQENFFEMIRLWNSKGGKHLSNNLSKSLQQHMVMVI